MLRLAVLQYQNLKNPVVGAAAVAAKSKAGSYEQIVSKKNDSLDISCAR
jgi:hypothetical protein